MTPARPLGSAVEGFDDRHKIDCSGMSAFEAEAAFVRAVAAQMGIVPLAAPAGPAAAAVAVPAGAGPARAAAEPPAATGGEPTGRERQSGQRKKHSRARRGGRVPRGDGGGRG